MAERTVGAAEPSPQGEEKAAGPEGEGGPPSPHPPFSRSASRSCSASASASAEPKAKAAGIAFGSPAHAAGIAFGSPAHAPPICVVCREPDPCPPRVPCPRCKDTRAHPACLLPWILARGSCPTCRTWLVEALPAPNGGDDVWETEDPFGGEASFAFGAGREAAGPRRGSRSGRFRPSEAIPTAWDRQLEEAVRAARAGGRVGLRGPVRAGPLRGPEGEAGPADSEGEDGDELAASYEPAAASLFLWPCLMQTLNLVLGMLMFVTVVQFPHERPDTFASPGVHPARIAALTGLPASGPSAATTGPSPAHATTRHPALEATSNLLVLLYLVCDALVFALMLLTEGADAQPASSPPRGSAPGPFGAASRPGPNGPSEAHPPSPRPAGSARQLPHPPSPRPAGSARQLPHPPSPRPAGSARQLPHTPDMPPSPSGPRSGPALTRPRRPTLTPAGLAALAFGSAAHTAAEERGEAGRETSDEAGRETRGDASRPPSGLAPEAPRRPLPETSDEAGRETRGDASRETSDNVVGFSGAALGPSGPPSFSVLRARNGLRAEGEGGPRRQTFLTLAPPSPAGPRSGPAPTGPRRPTLPLSSSAPFLALCGYVFLCGATAAGAAAAFSDRGTGGEAASREPPTSPALLHLTYLVSAHGILSLYAVPATLSPCPLWRAQYLCLSLIYGLLLAMVRTSADTALVLGVVLGIGSFFFCLAAAAGV